MLPWQWLCVCTLLSVLTAFSSSTNGMSHIRGPAINRTVYVDPSGKGDFRTIQAAIDSVPSYNDRWTCIRIKKGIYRCDLFKYIFLVGFTED